MQNTNNYLTNIRKYTILYVLFIIIIFVGIFFFNYSFISLSVDKGVSVTIANVINGTVSNINTGFNVVPKGTYVVGANRSDEQTKQTIEARPFSFQNVSLKLNPQKQLYKIASDTKSCVYGDVEEMRRGIIYSYDCNYLTQSFYSNFSESITNQPLNDSYNLMFAVPYKDGVIGINFPTEGGPIVVSLGYVSKTKEASFKISLSNASDLTEKNTKITVSDNKIFILNTSTGRVWVFNNILTSKNASQTTIKIPRTNSDLVNLQAYKDRLFVFTGVQPSINRVASDGLVGGTLYVFSLNNSLPEKNINIDDSKLTTSLFNFSVINKDTFVAMSPDSGGTVIVTLKKNTLSTTNILPGSTASIVHNGLVYILDNNGSVYRYSVGNRCLYLVYASKNTKITSIQSSGDFVILTGYSKSDGSQSQQTFLLENTDAKPGFKLSDVLPYTQPGELVPYSRVDYFGRQITIITSSPASIHTGSESIDNDGVKQAVDRGLMDSGVDLNKYPPKYIYR